MSSRPLKVGEMIKRALAGIFREELLDPQLERMPVIVSEVKITPDLKSVIIYVVPMVGSNISNASFLEIINRNSFQIRKLICKKVYLRYAPNLTFKIDESFEQASKMQKLINK